MKKGGILTLKEILSFVWENKYSDFYRKKYVSVGLSKKEVLDPKNFSKLPFLTRTELEAVLPGDRTFVGPEDVRFAVYTSGTTSQKPLVVYFSDIVEGKRKDQTFYLGIDPTFGTGAKRLYSLLPPLNKSFHHIFIQNCSSTRNKSFPIFGDLQNLPNNAVIMAETKADALYATPTLAEIFYEILKKYYDTSKIKLLVLCSETLTASRRQKLKELYPKAKIANVYGSSETGNFILYPCSKILKENKDLFHVLQPLITKAELIDGELTITCANNRAMPLIRYKTGDFFEIAKEKCGCGLSGPVLTWMGREGVDKIRAGGVEIKIGDVEKTFSGLNHLIGNGYQLHFYEERGQSGAKTKIIIEIKEESVKAKFIPAENLKHEILNYLMANWRLSGTSTLKDAIEKNFFEIPEIKLVKELSCTGVKARKLVSHLT
ncbi:MAG: AMP-binding protein [Candidatus Paceibacterota bacterium]